VQIIEDNLSDRSKMLAEVSDFIRSVKKAVTNQSGAP
jgi:hypothetical protein